jgi:hypothetical protein
MMQDSTRGMKHWLLTWRGDTRPLTIIIVASLSFDVLTSNSAAADVMTVSDHSGKLQECP